ncbi:hypothetical protein B0H94_102200 [Salsuginibacillus halophilus]|uniref:Uncharacterized protein n=1 Tax=Salsuginibacillus halophilus TaxID=517424 RepID=A0A2P8HXG0_9BACI|nr:hypothetical protein [Salsuginibacillus halophilus]PSL50923.1 hypothetical protein B0H94_102200 [Salsuginibacillus halophilus]
MTSNLRVVLIILALVIAGLILGAEAFGWHIREWLGLFLISAFFIWTAFLGLKHRRR